MNPPQPRLIDNGNGHPLASHWYRPAGEPRGYLLIVPAMGVEQRFYAPFAAWLAERGYLAITFDYLGMGQSRNGSLRGLEVDVLGWARHDCSAMLAAALAESGSKPLYWIGHSLGGQILPFVEGRERIDRVFSIASGSGYWKENSPRLRNKVWLFWYLVAPLLTPLLGYFPGRRLDGRRPAARGDRTMATLVPASAVRPRGWRGHPPRLLRRTHAHRVAVVHRR